MDRRLWATLVIAAIVMSAGCLSTGGSSGSEPEVELTSIGQNVTDDGQGVEVIGVAKNYGGASENTTVTIQLLNGSEPIAERTLQLGALDTDQSTQFSTTFDVDPARVDGRRITFG